jgi:hypothetical protein
VASFVHSTVEAAGGIVIGVFRGEIGWHNDEGAVMTAWPEGLTDWVELDRGDGEFFARAMEPTMRPERPEPLTEDGVYAHRWFQVARSDQDEFLELSAGAWPDFEGAHEGTRVIGLWRRADESEWLLLITRYPSLAMWEQSRPYNPDPSPGTDAARARFGRRAELTKRTIVRLSRLVVP